MESFVRDKAKMRSVDDDVRNKFNLSWLSERDENGDLFSDYIRKEYRPGRAFCVYCSDSLIYGSTGFSVLKLHAARAKHISNRPSSVMDKSAADDSTTKNSTSTNSTTINTSGINISKSTTTDNTNRTSTAHGGSVSKETDAVPDSTTIDESRATSKGTTSSSTAGSGTQSETVTNTYNVKVGTSNTGNTISPPASHSDKTTTRKPMSYWPQHFLTDRVEIKRVDAGVRNPFRTQWLSQVDVHGDLYGEYIKKPKCPGEAFCSYCQVIMAYGTGGKSSLKMHAKSNKHAENRLEALKQKSGSGSNPHSVEVDHNDHSYGCSAGEPTEGTSTEGADNIQDTTPPPNFSPYRRRKQRTKDTREVDPQGTLVAFVVEHDLSLSMVPHLVSLSKELGRDGQTLRTMKSYTKAHTQTRLINNMALPLRTMVVGELQKCRFSVCVGRSPNSGTKRMMTVLASYYSEEHGKVVVQHYLSEELPLPDAESMHATLVGALQEDNIPLSNLVSVLIDPSAYITASLREGFSDLLRRDAPQLLDISDACSVVDEIVRKFCSHFGQYLEELVEDICIDLDLTPDLLNKLKDICRVKDIEFEEPSQMAPREYLSIYDCILQIVQMRTALTLLYAAWLPEEEASKEQTKLYIDLMPETNDGKRLVLDVRDQCRQLPLTAESLARKRRIVMKLFTNRIKTLLLLNMYSSCLKKFKDYSVFCRSREPVVHLLFKKQKQLLLWYLQGFTKPELLQKRTDDPEIVNVRDESLHLPKEQLYMGWTAREILRSLEDDDKVGEEYLRNLKLAYLDTAELVQSSLCGPHVIRQMASLDPKVHGSAETWMTWSEMRTEHFLGVLNEDEAEEFEREVRMFQVEAHLPELEGDMRVDEWWTEAFKTAGNYPNLEKIIKTCLSVFIAAPVESAGALTREPPDTVPALQTVRYHYQCKEMTKYEKRKKALAAQEEDGAVLPPKEKKAIKGKKKVKDSEQGAEEKKKKRKHKEQSDNGSQPQKKKKKTDSVASSSDDEDAVSLTSEQTSDKTTSAAPLEVPSVTEDIVTIKEELVETEESTLTTMELTPVSNSHDGTAITQYDSIPPTDHGLLLEVAIKEEPSY